MNIKCNAYHLFAKQTKSIWQARKTGQKIGKELQGRYSFWYICCVVAWHTDIASDTAAMVVYIIIVFNLHLFFK